MISYPTLEHVAMQARPYPTRILEGAKDGLCLFAAGFLGHNDAIHMAEAGMRGYCVDTDGERLEEMRGLYPGTWWFLKSDAWEFAERVRKLQATIEGARYDVVSVDTFTGDAMLRSLASLKLWCSLARKAVTVTITRDALALLDPYAVPNGWKQSAYERSSDVSWLVLERRDPA